MMRSLKKNAAAAGINEICKRERKHELKYCYPFDLIKQILTELSAGNYGKNTEIIQARQQTRPILRLMYSSDPIFSCLFRYGMGNCF